MLMVDSFTQHAEKGYCEFVCCRTMRSACFFCFHNVFFTVALSDLFSDRRDKFSFLKGGLA